MRVKAIGPHVLVRWTHTQQSRIVRPDRYRQSGTNNADANVDDRRWRRLDGADRDVLVVLNMFYFYWATPVGWTIALHTDDKGRCDLHHYDAHDEIARVKSALDRLVQFELAQRRRDRYRAIVTSDGFDVGLVVAVGEPNIAGVEPGEYVLFDSGTAISIGWPATPEEAEAGEDGTQAGWAGHKLACLLDDEIEPPPDDLPGSEACRNWYHFIPADRIAASVGREKPKPGELA